MSSQKSPAKLGDLLLTKLADGLEGIDSPNNAFQRIYFDAPGKFIQDCFRWRRNQGPTDYQLSAAQALVDNNALSIRGPRGPGKTTFASWLILWFALTRDGWYDWKCPTTASNWRQVREFLWPEIHKWARMIRWDIVGRDPFDTRNELMQLTLRLKTGSAFGLVSSDPDFIEGAHADQILVVFDEAKAIPTAVFDAMEGTLVGGGATEEMKAMQVVISTPGKPVGRFYEIHAHKAGLEHWAARRWSLQDAIDAGRYNPERAESLRRLWGEHSAMYKQQVLGEFADDGEDGVIPLEWIELAVDRFYERQEDGAWGPLEQIGVDVGLSYNKSVFALRHGWSVSELREYGAEHAETATMVTAGRVKGLLTAHEDARAMIDVVGIGAGVVHRLKEQKMNVMGFNASTATNRKTKTKEFGFVDTRSAAWWYMRELLHPEFGEPIALPPDDELIGDLTAPTYLITSGGNIKVESKDSIIKKIRRSTDRGDAVIMSFWEGKERPWLAM